MRVLTPQDTRSRPGLDAWAQLVLTETRLVWRDPAGVVLPLALPLIILVMNSLGADRTGLPELGGLAALDVYVTPLSLLMVLAMVGLINLPSHLATYRATRVLRRLAATPAHPAMVLVAQVLVNLALAAAGVAMALGVAFTVLDMATPRNPGGTLLALGLAAAAMYAVGLLIAAVAPSANAAIAIGLLAFFGTMVLGGGFAPRENLPDVLARVGEHTPFGAALDALSASWAGQAPTVAQTVALALTTLVAGALAARLFRWE